MNTYKVHALGDYVEIIKTYSTTDSYSIELVGEIALILIHESLKANHLHQYRVNWSIAVPRDSTNAPPKRDSSSNLCRSNEDKPG
jgi:hypothetical protein